MSLGSGCQSSELRESGLHPPEVTESDHLTPDAGPVPLREKGAAKSGDEASFDIGQNIIFESFVISFCPPY